MISRKAAVKIVNIYGLVLPLLIFSLYFLQVFISNVHPAFFATLLAVPFILFGFLYFLSLHLSLIDFFAYGYIFWCCISGFFTIYNGYPYLLFIKQICYSVIPIFFFFIGKSKKETTSFILLGYLLASFFCFICGFIWVITKPQYYITYLSSYIYKFNLIYWLAEPRMNSFLGSICVGILGPISAWISFVCVRKTKKKFLFYLLFLFCEVASVASFQRFSYAMSLIILLLFLSYSLIDKTVRKYGIITIAAIIVAICLLLCFSPDLLNSVLSKFSSFSSAFSDRSYQWSYVFSLGGTIIFGRGLGTFSHAAIGYTSELVTDGAFINILGETGVIGALLFSIIVILSIVSFFKNRRNDISVVCFGIVSIFLLASLGSNSFLYPVLAPLFWLSLGGMNFEAVPKWGVCAIAILATRAGDACPSDYQHQM